MRWKTASEESSTRSPPGAKSREQSLCSILFRRRDTLAMIPSSDAQLSARPEQGVEVPRLFAFDLPRLKPTGQPLPEPTAISGIHRVLDIASGNGGWTISAAHALPQVQFVGIEPNAGLVDRARSQPNEYRTNHPTSTSSDPSY